jgi:hypothetical protein
MRWWSRRRCDFVRRTVAAAVPWSVTKVTAADVSRWEPVSSKSDARYRVSMEAELAMEQEIASNVW